MKKMIGLIALAFSLISGAAEIWMTTGVVTEAKLSQKMPEISGFEAENFPNLPERRVYAMVTIDVVATRKISIFDYAIEFFGRDYPCIALREEHGKWKSTEKTFPGGKKYSLLFILNGGMVGMRDQETVTLKNCASQMKVSLPLQNLRTAAF